MHVRSRISVATCAALMTLSFACTTAIAASVTVKLRVEGSTKTLFEGEVAASPETIETHSSNGPHPCDYAQNGSPEGHENEGNDSGTPTTALHQAALTSGLEFDAMWYGSGKEENGNPGDFFVSQVGSDINQTSGEYASWGYAVNDTTAPVGGCQIALAPGNEVLWAYNYFNLKHLLSLSAPTTANVGTTFTVHVTDGQTGAPIEGAEVGEDVSGVTGSGPKTNSDGNATIVLSHTGTVTLKATQIESVRSNGAVVCVHNGNDGSCGTSVAGKTQSVTANSNTTTGGSTTPPTADVAKVLGVENSHAYPAGHSPRLLGGAVEVPSGATLRQVRISLHRSYRGHCFNYSGSRERFVKGKCQSASFFPVGSTESFSYLLPSRLPAGHYTYEIEAVDDTGATTKLSPGVSRVVFSVK